MNNNMTIIIIITTTTIVQTCKQTEILFAQKTAAHKVPLYKTLKWELIFYVSVKAKEENKCGEIKSTKDIYYHMNEHDIIISMMACIRFD
jgi:hypothetical protein